MNGLFQKVVPLTMVVALAILQPTAHAAAKCKGQSKSSCTGNSDCSWVSGYETKAGKKVDGYCRVKSGKKKSSEKASKKDKQTSEQVSGKQKQSKEQAKKQSKKGKEKQSKDQAKKQSKKAEKSQQDSKSKKGKETSKEQ